ncbi:hypothetical protein SAMN05444274_10581 [Mariniphaga anaerophila]|uniref:YgjP-like metallopeptidase domain-containing protein n=1 Tax=Mariniphaga anaerophila TaxID=1484053 RepID=A0A1M5BBZ6_9BACT|nr:SprT family zinc-dependent metalloprotease [Mariniphaga anaerophila]SHF40039.1 hypothetical protein SAMN05444274_10581 [Mariniphaga anaerophila]
MPNKVVHFKSIGPVTFFRNRRSKNMKISVKPDKSVLISFPYFISEKEALSFLSKNETWIKTQQERVSERRKKYESGEVFSTKLHTVQLLSGSENDVETAGNVVKIYSDNFESEKGRVFLDNILTQVFRYEARTLLPPRIKTLALAHNFSFNKITIRNNKRNWGSCSSQNNISLNLQMMKLPDHLIDYILLHELVHTEIKNHSEKFWKKLDQVSNGKARELAGEVKKYSTYTI